MPSACARDEIVGASSAARAAARAASARHPARAEVDGAHRGIGAAPGGQPVQLPRPVRPDRVDRRGTEALVARPPPALADWHDQAVAHQLVEGRPLCLRIGARDRQPGQEVEGLGVEGPHRLGDAVPAVALAERRQLQFERQAPTGLQALRHVGHRRRRSQREHQLGGGRLIQRPDLHHGPQRGQVVDERSRRTGDRPHGGQRRSAVDQLPHQRQGVHVAPLEVVDRGDRITRGGSDQGVRQRTGRQRGIGMGPGHPDREVRDGRQDRDARQDEARRPDRGDGPQQRRLAHARRPLEHDRAALERREDRPQEGGPTDQHGAALSSGRRDGAGAAPRLPPR